MNNLIGCPCASLTTPQSCRDFCTSAIYSSRTIVVLFAHHELSYPLEYDHWLYSPASRHQKVWRHKCLSSVMNFRADNLIFCSSSDMITCMTITLSIFWRTMAKKRYQTRTTCSTRKFFGIDAFDGYQIDRKHHPHPIYHTSNLVKKQLFTYKSLYSCQTGHDRLWNTTKNISHHQKLVRYGRERQSYCNQNKTDHAKQLKTYCWNKSRWITCWWLLKA